MSQTPFSPPKLIATSVVRGSQMGESHGGVYTIDFGKQEVKQVIDWNSADIDWTGRGWDRGLRGIAFYSNHVYIAASDELFVYDQAFNLLKSFKNPYLKHCHEICIKDDLMMLTSTGFDSLLTFNLKEGRFVWAMQIKQLAGKWSGQAYDPSSDQGPGASNENHFNMVHASREGLFLSGLRTEALLLIDGQMNISELCNLPAGTHNARPLGEGVVFNDTASNCVRYVDRSGEQSAFGILTFPEEDISFSGVDDSKVARQGFGRGLCVIDDRYIAGGSSPSTVSIYDLSSGKRVTAVNLSMDIRNAIHGLAVWPY